MKFGIPIKCILFLVVAGIVATNATTWYVDPQSTDGSAIRPWKTVSYAITKSSPGSVIYLKADALFTEKVYIASQNDNALYVYNAGYVCLENIRFTGQGMDIHQTDGVSFYADNGGHDSVLIVNCEFSGFGKSGLVIGGWNSASSGFRRVRVNRSSFHDNRRCGANTYAQDPSAHQNIVVSNCRAYNNPGDPAATPQAGRLVSGLLMPPM